MSNNNQSIEFILDEIYKILRNDEGLYHGWYWLTVTKYGSFVAHACLNPPEADMMDETCRTSTYHWHGQSPLEVLTLLLSELKLWEEQGKPYDISLLKDSKYERIPVWDQKKKELGFTNENERYQVREE